MVFGMSTRGRARPSVEQEAWKRKSSRRRGEPETVPEHLRGVRLKRRRSIRHERTPLLMQIVIAGVAVGFLLTVLRFFFGAHTY